MVGTALGAGYMAKKMRRENKINIQKMLRRIGM
jgi:hypothetical protein